ncbi:hypothetical protein JXA34_00555 [Patescibacteria group bacterium]|nr:hypothetical protein [Patescibacteria group bacterium]
MYYVLLLLLFGLLYYVFAKILSSMIKGCLVSAFILIVVLAGIILYKSTKEPVNILGLYVVDNFEITRKF